MFLFSFIIPIYNAEKYLQQCLDVILIDANPDVQVVLINDGSKDHSAEVCASYQKAHPNQVVYISKQNAGVSAARNDGIRAAEGEYLVFIDSDDLVQPHFTDRLRKLVAIQADLYVYGYQTIDEDGKIVSGEKNQKEEKSNEVNAEDLDASYCKTIFSTLEYQAWNKVFCSRIIRKYEIVFDTGMRWSEDLDFWTRYAMHTGTIARTKEILYNYRINTAGAVASSNIDSIRSHHKAFQNQLALLKCKQADMDAYRNATQAYVEHQSQTIRQCKEKGVPNKQIKEALKTNEISADLKYQPYSVTARYKRLCVQAGFIRALILYFKIIEYIK